MYAAHFQVLGFLVMGLMVLQVLLGVCRPDKSHQ